MTTVMVSQGKVPVSAMRRLKEQVQNKDFDAALNECAQYLPLCPNDIQLLTLTGELLLSRDMYEPAEKVLLRANALQPDDINLLILRTRALNGLQRFEASEALCQDFLSHTPTHGEILFALAVTLKSAGQYKEAIIAYERASEVMPYNDAVFNNLGNLHAWLGSYEEALFCYQRSADLAPNNADAWGNWADALYNLRRFDESLSKHEHALSLNGGSLKQFVNYANTLQAISRWDDAIANYDHALHLCPDDAESWSSRGNALRGKRQFLAAEASFLEAIRLNPELAQAHWNLALLYLQLGDFKKGLLMTEWRWHNHDLGLKTRDYTQPLWLGDSSVAGQRVLIWEEQGMGDKIMMLRYAKLLIERGADVIVELPPALLSVARTLDPRLVCLPTGETPQDFDLHCPYMSLPLAFGTTLETIPAFDAYLSAPPDAEARWQHKLGARSRDEVMRVGLVWSGAKGHHNDHHRSMALRELEPLLSIAGIRYWSLQKEIRETDRETLISWAGAVQDESQNLTDFGETAGLIAQMDLVISVDTSVAHLAAAMGKPVWLLLPADADYRWMDKREDSPWYPSMRLFRQFKSSIHTLQQLLAEVKRMRT